MDVKRNKKLDSEIDRSVKTLDRKNLRRILDEIVACSHKGAVSAQSTLTQNLIKLAEESESGEESLKQLNQRPKKVRDRRKRKESLNMSVASSNKTGGSLDNISGRRRRNRAANKQKNIASKNIEGGSCDNLLRNNSYDTHNMPTLLAAATCVTNSSSAAATAVVSTVAATSSQQKCRRPKHATPISGPVQQPPLERHNSMESLNSIQEEFFDCSQLAVTRSVQLVNGAAGETVSSVCPTAAVIGSCADNTNHVTPCSSVIGGNSDHVTSCSSVIGGNSDHVTSCSSVIGGCGDYVTDMNKALVSVTDSSKHRFNEPDLNCNRVMLSNSLHWDQSRDIGSKKSVINMFDAPDKAVQFPLHISHTSVQIAQPQTTLRPAFVSANNCLSIGPFNGVILSGRTDSHTDTSTTTLCTPKRINNSNVRAENQYSNTRLKRQKKKEENLTKTESVSGYRGNEQLQALLDYIEPATHKKQSVTAGSTRESKRRSSMVTSAATSLVVTTSTAAAAGAVAANMPAKPSNVQCQASAAAVSSAAADIAMTSLAHTAVAPSVQSDPHHAASCLPSAVTSANTSSAVTDTAEVDNFSDFMPVLSRRHRRSRVGAPTSAAAPVGGGWGGSSTSVTCSARLATRARTSTSISSRSAPAAVCVPHCSDAACTTRRSTDFLRGVGPLFNNCVTGTDSQSVTRASVAVVSAPHRPVSCAVRTHLSLPGHTPACRDTHSLAASSPPSKLCVAAAQPAATTATVCTAAVQQYAAFNNTGLTATTTRRRPHTPLSTPAAAAAFSDARHMLTYMAHSSTPVVINRLYSGCRLSTSAAASLHFGYVDSVTAVQAASSQTATAAPSVASGDTTGGTAPISFLGSSSAATRPLVNGGAGEGVCASESRARTRDCNCVDRFCQLYRPPADIDVSHFNWREISIFLSRVFQKTASSVGVSQLYDDVTSLA